MPSSPSTTSAATTDPASLTAPAAHVERYLAQLLQRDDLPRNLIAAIDYALLGAGKRLRPILVLRAAEAVGSTFTPALPPAAAIEMIHCFSLVHDDLPAMDDDDLRRGRPTLHRHTNEAMAILAGDAMMGLAFELLAVAVTPQSKALSLIRELALGTNAMIAGQVYDTLPDFPADTPPLQRLKTIHSHKTGALIRAAVRMGAIAADATPAQLDAISRYGDAIGLMFQIVDDVIDVTQSTEHLGKTAGKDADQHKLTYPAVLGLDQSRSEITRLHSEAHAALDSLHGDPAHLRALCDYMAVRTR